MSTTGELLLEGKVQRGYTLGTKPAVAYEYLSDIKTLLSQVPNVTKLQVGKTTGRTRLYFQISILGVVVNAVLDVEPQFYTEQQAIRIKNTEEPIAAIPPNHFTGKFNALIKVQPTESGKARVTCQMIIAFDASPLVERGLFSRNLLETSGVRLLQEYAERICDDYILNLLEDFKKWLPRHSD